MHSAINGKSHLCLSVILKKKTALSPLSLPRRVSTSSSSSEFCFFFFNLLQSSASSIFFLCAAAIPSSSLLLAFLLLGIFFAFLRRTVGVVLLRVSASSWTLSFFLEVCFSFALLLLPPLLPSMAETAIGKLLGCLRIT